MAEPITEKFEEMTLEVSTDGGTVFAKLCGLVGVSISRTAQTDTSEVPADCDDESLPLKVNKSVRSVDVSVSADGVWAQTSDGIMKDWFYDGLQYQVRLGNTKAAVGNTEFEVGPANLTQLNNARTKGQVVNASIQIEFNGTPSRVAKA